MEEDIFMKYHDGKDRCSWANPKNPIYIDYHDKEWGGNAITKTVGTPIRVSL